MRLLFISLFSVLSIITPNYLYAEDVNGFMFQPSPNLIYIESSTQLPTLPDSLTFPEKEGFYNILTEKTSDGAEVGTVVLNPSISSFVNSYESKFTSYLSELKYRSETVLSMIGKILESYGIPKELKYLAVIESKLQANATSGVGAKGIWQFMPGTARNMGLRVSDGVDERTNMYKSTHAASKYLNSLYDIYGDWLLVVAAYNSGPGGVNSAIKRSGSRDFWSLQNFLPDQTRNHVKRYIATHYIMEGKAGLTTLTKRERIEQKANEFPAFPNLWEGTLTQHISGRYVSKVITQFLDIDPSLFAKLNPNFDESIATNAKYVLRLPEEKMYSFLEKKQTILSESVQSILDPNYQASTASAK